MSFLRKYQPKHVVVDENNPSALGQCDYTDFTFNHKDLVKQMQWVGNNKVWTGYMVGKPYVDELNEQSRPPLVKADPYPVINARLPTPYTDPEANPVLSPPQLLAKLQNFNWGA